MRKRFSLVWRNDRAGQHGNAKSLSALKIAYLPKKTFFGIEKMIAGTQIAALDHNHNVNREQVQTTIIFFSPEFLLSVST